MKNSSNWVVGPATPDKQEEEIKFDASQYEFFGKNVLALELGDTDYGMDDAEPSDEDAPVQCMQGEDVMSSSFVDELAVSFTMLNNINESRSPRGSIVGVPSPVKGFDKNPKAIPQRRWNGIVKWFQQERGYGFLRSSESEEDIFVHYSSLKTDGYIHLEPGTFVEFEVVAGQEKGLQAINVTAPSGRLLKDTRNINYVVALSPASSRGISITTGTNVNNIGPCFYCGQRGHMAKNCYHLMARDGVWSITKLSAAVWQSNGAVEPGTPVGYAWCCNCGKLGHLVHQCPYGYKRTQNALDSCSLPKI